jgi:pyrroline-5-carboxylate reductase
MEIRSFSFIGGGRVTQFLLHALKNGNALPETVIITDPDENVRNRAQMIDPEKVQCSSNNVDALKADVLFLAVHPPVFKDLGAEISGKIGKGVLVISLIPVVTIEKLRTMTGTGKVIRMIPNAPSIIHLGFNPVTYSNEITQTEKQALNNIFKQWGDAPEVEEKKLEAYAIVTAMGPTYFWPLWIRLQELGKEFGLSEGELNKGMASMLRGSLDLIYHSGLPAREVMDLIPVYPLKEKEAEILSFFDDSLKALYQKLTGGSK